MINIRKRIRKSISAVWLQISDSMSVTALSPFVQRHLMTLVIRRVRLISAVMAVLFVGWIGIDVIVFEWPLWGLLASGRIVLAFVLIGLAWPRDIEQPIKVGFFMLSVMVTGPVVFYLFSNTQIWGANLSAAGEVFAAIYSLLPFMMLAILGLFPLTLIEVGLLGATILAVMAFGLLRINDFNWVGYIRDLWLGLLVLSVSVIGCIAQLRYMVSSVGQASLDPLTGSFSRRSGSEIMDIQFHVAERQNSSFSMAFLDLDNFKSVNDDYGHDEGDRILCQMVNVLKSRIRDSDVIIRWGGEEFVIMLPNTDEKGIRIFLRRIMTDWFGERPDGTPLTASIGVAERIADGKHDWHQLVDLADKRMYMAKQSGRSRAIITGNKTVQSASAPAAS